MTPTSLPPRYVDYRSAAHHLGLPVGTLYALVSRRAIPHLRLGPRLVRFDPTELDAWMNAQRVAEVSK